MLELDALFIRAMQWFPEKRFSRAVRALGQIPSKRIVREFAHHFAIAVHEAEKPLDQYGTLLEFFTRRLKAGARPIDSTSGAFVSPVDGSHLVSGAVGDGRLVQAKGRTYTIEALLADPRATETFRNGTHITLYLSPRDYHRVHSPVRGRITGVTHVPGSLFPVNRAGVAHVDELFARNERVVMRIDSEEFGRVAVVMVGATSVGRIALSFDASIRTNVARARRTRTETYAPPIPIARGDELGVFELGSTVVLVSERPIRLISLSRDESVRVGMRLGVVGE